LNKDFIPNRTTFPGLYRPLAVEAETLQTKTQAILLPEFAPFDLSPVYVDKGFTGTLWNGLKTLYRGEGAGQLTLRQHVGTSRSHLRCTSAVLGGCGSGFLLRKGRPCVRGFWVHL
jgi:hypothetical protein